MAATGEEAVKDVVLHVEHVRQQYQGTRKDSRCIQQLKRLAKDWLPSDGLL